MTDEYDVMRRAALVARHKKLPCTITPAEVRQVDLIVPQFEINHGKPGPIRIEEQRERKTA